MKPRLTKIDGRWVCTGSVEPAKEGHGYAARTPLDAYAGWLNDDWRTRFDTAPESPIPYPPAPDADE